MKVQNGIKGLALLGVISLAACRSATVPHEGLANPLKPSVPDFSRAALANERDGTHSILDQVLARQPQLGVCTDFFNLKQAKSGSTLYPVGPDQYVVQLLCFQAAYQGNYAFLSVDQTAGQPHITPLKLTLAGYPVFDAQTKILGNSYKFRGIGDCIERSEHRWTGGNFVLLTSELVETAPGSCEIFQGGTAYEITPTRVGLAQLGMTLGELRTAMGEEASFSPTALGVDQGDGLEVSNYGEVQFVIGSHSGAPLDDASVISFIRVTNPNYKTSEGVGPGTALKQAIAQYGKASLSLNLENESREYITFEKGLPRNVWIQSNQWALDGAAGLYPESSDSYRTTEQFKEKAAIGSFTLVQSQP